MFLLNQSIFLSRETAHHCEVLQVLPVLLRCWSRYLPIYLCYPKLTTFTSVIWEYLEFSIFVLLPKSQNSLGLWHKKYASQQGLLSGCFCPIVLTHEICQNDITISMNVEYYGVVAKMSLLGEKNTMWMAHSSWSLSKIGANASEAKSRMIAH